MRGGENRFNPDTLDELEALLDELEAAEGAAALVLTGEGKFFSNGLDLEWMGSAPEGGAQELAERVCRMLARVLIFPRPVVAAINGHCFAAGAMLSLACDARVMRADRGFWCLPEADINIPFTSGMSRLITARLTNRTAHEAMLTAKRYGGTDAAEAGIVERATDEDRVLAEAVAIAAASAGRSPGTLAAIKRGMYSDVVGLLELPLAEQAT
ncbi:enoyl-CoA hydratase/isomerase family protein [Thermoleophilia bacterium SCSIO 60948]|nr:enoyl-CoA hydratase/isomerase family protein [Thermoleophilia bacterium SCSIO 60948]